MHRRGVFHGDLKPHNIMLSKNGQVKLIDFGTAWIRGQTKDRIQGTPQFMAPEQAIEKVVDQKTDIYKFGHDLSVHRPVRAGGHSQARRRKEGHASFQAQPRIPADLNTLIVACLQSDPDKHPADMFEVRDQLSKIAKQMGLEEVDLKGADGE